MASKVLEAKRFTQIIKHQMEILREETDSFKVGVDEFFNRVQIEVDALLNGGQVNQTTCAEMSNTIQKHITFLISKSVELSDPLCSGNNEQQTSLTGKSTKKSPNVFTHCSSKTDAKHFCEEGADKPGISSGENLSQIVTMRLATLEDVILSLKGTTEKVQKDQEKVDTMLKDVSSQQEYVNRKIQTLSDSSLKSQQLIKEKITEAEQIKQIDFLNIDSLKESFKKHDLKLNGLKDASKDIDISINELNKQLGLVQTLSDRTSVSLQELSKKVESTNQQTCDKISKIENSINLMSSGHPEKFEDMRSLNRDKFNDLIGMVCQLLAKRLTTPLESLNTSLSLINKEQLGKKKSVESRVEEISKTVSLIESKCFLPNIGFYARTSSRCTGEIYGVENYEDVEDNYEDHFDPSTGTFTAPLDGLYLISVTSGAPVALGIYLTRCYLKSNDNLQLNSEDKNLFDTRNSQTITRCIGMKAGDVVYLQTTTFDKNSDILISIDFSCCLIK